jgi:urease alpha subunit
LRNLCSRRARAHPFGPAAKVEHDPQRIAPPKIEINPETYDVKADRELLVCEPAEKQPMAQRCFLF